MILDRIKSLPDLEINHRISNNLAMISGLLRRKSRRLQERDDPITGDEARGVLNEAAFQIEVVANLHKLLSNQAQGPLVDLDQYFRSVCNAAVPSLSTDGRVRPQYMLDCGYRAAPDFAVSMGLAVAELLTNAIRYAHPSGADGKIAVAAMRRGDLLVIEVADDGVGLPGDYDPTSDDSLGLRLVHQTAARWGGKVELEDSEPGLCVRLVMPSEAGQVDT